MFFIYKITNKINGKIYIGSSDELRGLDTRWSEHVKASYQKSRDCYNYPLQRAIRKYGPENFTYEVVERGLETREERAEREKAWIILCNSLTNTGHGYNQTLYTDCALSDPEIHRQHMAKVSKPCALVDDNENILQVFPSASEASRFAGQKSNSSVIQICNGDLRSINNLVFRWIKEDGTIIIPEFKTRKRRVKILGINIEDENDIVYADSVSEAARIFGIERASLSKCINGSSRYSVVHGRRWYKADEYNLKKET